MAKSIISSQSPIVFVQMHSVYWLSMSLWTRCSPQLGERYSDFDAISGNKFLRNLNFLAVLEIWVINRLKGPQGSYLTFMSSKTSYNQRKIIMNDFQLKATLLTAVISRHYVYKISSLTLTKHWLSRSRRSSPPPQQECWLDMRSISI